MCDGRQQGATVDDTDNKSFVHYSLNTIASWRLNYIDDYGNHGIIVKQQTHYGVANQKEGKQYYDQDINVFKKCCWFTSYSSIATVQNIIRVLDIAYYLEVRYCYTCI